MNIKTFIKLGITAITLSYLQGCATVTRSSTVEYMVKSVPPGADVQLSTGETCITPCTLTKKRKLPFIVTVSKDGYVAQEHQIESKTSKKGATGMAGNILAGGIIGMGIDAASGAAKDLTPNPLEVELIEIGAESSVETMALENLEETMEVEISGSE